MDKKTAAWAAAERPQSPQQLFFRSPNQTPTDPDYSLKFARYRTVRDTPHTAVRSHISRSLLSITRRFLATSTIIFRLLLLGSTSCLPVLGQTAAGAPALQLSSATLKWDRSPSRDVKGYRVHFGTESGKYHFSIDVGKRTSCKITNLIVGKKYYFAVAAYNARGNESLVSNESSLVVPPSKIR